MFRSRIGPALAVTALLGGGIYWQTRGGMQQPASRSRQTPGQESAGVSQSLQGAAGTGGSTAQDQPKPEDVQAHTQTKVWSNSPDAPAKKNPQKARDGGDDQLGPVHPLQAGKHAGEKDFDIDAKKDPR